MVFTDMRFWHLLILGLLVPTCAQPTTQPTSIVVMSKTPGEEADMSTPPEVPESKLPALSEYVIRTRVVVEYVLLTKDKDLITMYAVTPNEIYRDFEEAHKIYAPLHLKFEINEVVFRKYSTGITQFYDDALKYPDTMSVYYILPHAFPYAGLSSAPWESLSQGILLSIGRNELTLTHEIGHYFGLLHTFHPTGDFCKDTVPQTNGTCEGDQAGCEPNCGNLMNYCIHDARNVTADQFDRMRRFLRSQRSNHIHRNADLERANIEEMYNQILEISVHNYKELENPDDPPCNDQDDNPVPDHH